MANQNTDTPRPTSLLGLGRDTIAILVGLASIVAMMYLDISRSRVLEANLREDIALLRADMREDTNSLREDISNLENSLRSDMTDMEERLRSEMTDMEERLRSEITANTNDLRAEMAESRRIFLDRLVEQEGRIARVETLHEEPNPHSHGDVVPR